MEIYNRLYDFSSSIYSLIDAIEENLQKQESLNSLLLQEENMLKKAHKENLTKQDLLFELLDDLFLQEENYLDSLSQKELDEIILFLQNNFGVHFTESALELYVQKKLDIIKLRVYERVKELQDKRAFTSLKTTELSSLPSNLLVFYSEQAIDSLKKIDIQVAQKLEKKTFLQYIFSSFRTPYTMLKNMGSEDVSMNFNYSLNLVMPCLFSLIQKILLETDSNLKNKISKLFIFYLNSIDSIYYDEIFEYFEFKFQELLETSFVTKDSFAQLNQLLIRNGFSPICYEKEEFVFPDIEMNLNKFCYGEVKEFQNVLDELLNITELELTEYMAICKSKSRCELRMSREKNYEYLKRLVLARKRILNNISDFSKFMDYTSEIFGARGLSLPIEIAKCVEMNEQQHVLDLYELKENLKIDRLRQILLEHEKQQNESNILSEMIQDVYDMDDTVVALVPMEMEPQYTLEASDDILIRTLNDVSTNYYNVLKCIVDNNFSWNMYLLLFLLLYRDPNLTFPLIYNDFEYYYPYEDFTLNEEEIKDCTEDIFHILEIAHSEYQEVHGELYDTVYAIFLSLWESFLSKEDFEQILELFGNDKIFYLRERMEKLERKRKNT